MSKTLIKAHSLGSTKNIVCDSTGARLIPEGTVSSRCVKRLSLQVSQQLHREAKLAAIEDEETINSMVVSLLRRHLKERKEAIEASQRRGSSINRGIY